MAKLSLQHIYKIYDNGTKAVNDFNLEIGDNEFVVFVGPSGCGKSTTLRMIAGLEDITAGDFYIDGQLANQLEPKDRDMAMVFQNYALYPHMTVYENMAFGLKIRHIPKTEIETRVNEAAAILDIKDQLTKKPKAMSGGQRQRVALGRAIVRKPKVFLLDEPLSNLDAKLRSSMRSEIIRLHNVLQTTFIYVTHDQVEAMTMGSKIVVMRDGVIQQVDTPMNLYDYPNNIFVAGFIGTPQMNFLDAKLSFNDKKEIELHLGSKVITCPKDTFKKLDLLNVYMNKEVKLGIRPEHLLLSKEEKNSLPATINIVEALGNDCNLIVETKDGLKMTIKTLRDDTLKVGDQINVTFDFNKIHLFDKETEHTLLDRIPLHSTLVAQVKKDELNILGKKIKLGEVLENLLPKDKNLFVTLNSKSIAEGKDFVLPIINKEQIGDKWLNTLQNKDEILFVLTDEYYYGDKFEFSLRQEELTVYDEEFNKLAHPVIEDNIIDGKLLPVKRNMLFAKHTMMTEAEYQRMVELANANGEKTPRSSHRNVRLFNYSLLNETFVPEDEAVIKIYALLGKKFHLHDVKFSVPVDKIEIGEEGILGVVKEVHDYGTAKYYIINVNEQILTVKDNGKDLKVDDEIHINIEPSSIGVYDTNFGVKLL